MQEDRKVEIVGRYAAQLSIIELALGSVLHSFHIPFAGNLLSLNQGYFLCGAALEEKEQSATRVQQISNVAAVLKSLSPAGKKLGPMLSLSMQGLLFSLGIGVFGVNSFGLCLAMILLATWTFVQPLLTYYLFFGSELFSGVQYLYQKTLPFHGIPAKSILVLFLLVVGIKLLLAAAVAQVAIRRRGTLRWEERLLQLANERGAKSAGSRSLAAGLWKDMTSPLFLLSLAITAFFLYFSEHTAGMKIWLFLRPVAVAFGFFYFSRTLTLDRWLQKLQKTRFERFARACDFALQEVRRKMTSRQETIGEN